MNPSEEPGIFDAISNSDRLAFERLFKHSYRPLTAYGLRFVRDLPTAENIVQDVFLKLWQNRKEMTITTSLEHYLFRAVRNHSLNFLDKAKVRSAYLRMQTGREEYNEDYRGFYPEIGLLEIIEKEISALPEKRQEIFRLAREEGLKYREIADQLKISVKTVEAQMSLALKQLRETLKKYNHMILFFMFTGKGIPELRCQSVVEVVKSKDP
jgi:RNA polymerase sigma-70 factor (ECF subfamily)